MVLLGVFALIFSLNNKKNESLGAGNEEFNAEGIINGDKGYISSAQVIQTKTGTGPWDANDEPGNDSSEDNNIVRSFDQVIWTVESTMQMKSNSGVNSLTGGILNIEAKLPETCTYMKWDIESMTWTEGTGKLSNAGRTLSAQYKMSESNITVPGKQTLTLVLKLEGAKNALEIKPEIKVWLEGNEENEKCTVTNVENVYVSSAPKYDIRLVNRGASLETNTTEGDARVYQYSFAFLLKGDTTSKGLKGVEYPQGDLTFDVNYDLQRTIIGQSNYEDITNGNIKLYNYKYNDATTTTLGKKENSITSFPSNLRRTYGILPYSSSSDKRRGVYKNGNLKIEDNENGLMHVTISNYGYNGTFPDRNDNSSYPTDSGYSYTEDIGFISIGVFYMQVNMNEETTKENTQCYINIEANNMKVNTVGGDTCTKEVNIGNNSIRANHITYPKGSFSKNIQYLNSSGGILEYSWGEGNAKTAINSEIRIRSRIINSINNAKKDWIWGTDELIKFDDEAMEPILLSNSAEYQSSGVQGSTNMKFNILYAGKQDKTGWNSDSEMIKTTAAELVYFDTLEELKQNGYVCVAVMAESQSGYVASGIEISLSIPMKLKDTAKVGEVYQTVNDVWIYNEGNAPDRSTQTYLKTTDRSNFPPTVWSQGNLPYVKTSYDSNGQMEQGSHGGGLVYGNSLLIIGAEQKVGMTSWNEDVTERKTNYDIGRNENIINYRIAPQLNGNADIDGVTVKLTTTLPKGLEYVAGSADYREPNIINNSDGTTTLIWEIYNCSVGESIRTIDFKVHIDEETANGTQYTTQTVILADNDKVGNSDPKNRTEKIENLTDEITYDIVYKATLEDYIGEAEVTIVDKLPYQIVVDSSDLAGGKYDATAKTITWTETIKDINSYENKNNEITINKTIKVVYTGINQGTTNIKNVVTGKIKTKTPEKEFDEVTANETTTTEFTVNIPVSKVWEDDSNKLGQRPTKVTFKLVGSDGSEYTKELAKPGTAGSSTTQDQSNPNRWNDIFTNLPKYDSNNQEIKYTLTEINGNLTYYDAVLDSTGRIVTNTNKYGKVTVHYYIMNTDGTLTTTRVPSTSGAEVQDVIIEGKEGEEYHTTWANNVNEKYELVTSKLPTNATGTIEKYNEEKPQEVIYYYRLKPAKVLINYLEKDEDTDDSNNQVLTMQEQIDGHVDDKYNTNTDHRKETIQKDGRTYTLVEDSGNTEGTMTVADTTVTYYYLQNTKATVRYVARDPETHEIVKDLEEPYTQEGLVGDEFVTNEKAFIGYKLVESPTNKTITMTKEEQTLIYYYEPVYTGLIENHIDDRTGKVLYTEEHQIQVGTEYNIPSKEFAGYDLVETKLPTNASGIMGEELVTVNYYYIKKAVLEVNYIDIYTNKPLTDQIVDNTKHEGDVYTTEQKTFENYDLVEVPSNATGTMKVETDEEGNITNNRTVVTYYYTQRAIVEEHHIDSLTGKDIEEPTIHNGHVGDKYDIPSKEFLSYQLIEEDEEGNSMLPANSKGTMTAEKIVVNYSYNQPAKVIVHYVEKATGKELEELNEETGEPQNSQVTIEGFNQDEYTTEAKEFKYYTLIETPENKEGQMKVEIVEDEEGNKTVNNTIDVYYYYQAKPFNIGVEKEITGIVVNGESRTPTNGKLERIEIYRKDVEKTNIQIVYRIRVINNGEVEGAVTIEDKLPEGMTLANNDRTWEEQDGVLRKIIPEINPGETKEYTVVLDWNTAENNMGEKDNIISIVDTQNVPGFIDNNDKDNTSNANVIISVETGELPIGLILALVALLGLETVTLRYAVVLTKRQKKNK